MAIINGLSVESVKEILKDVFASMVNLPLEEPSAGQIMTVLSATAIVGLIGKPGKIVMLRAGEKFACAAAGGMLMSEYPAWNDEVRDAFAEIANMAAGNIKTKCFPENGFSLSLPTVIFGADYSMSSAKMRLILETRMSAASDILSITVSEEL